MSWVKPIIQDEPIRIRFIQEWMGNPIGTEKEMWEHAAVSLVSRGVAEVIEEPLEKSLDSPPMDKMVKKPQVKKVFRRKHT